LTLHADLDCLLFISLFPDPDEFSEYILFPGDSRLSKVIRTLSSSAFFELFEGFSFPLPPLYSSSLMYPSWSTSARAHACCPFLFLCLALLVFPFSPKSLHSAAPFPPELSPPVLPSLAGPYVCGHVHTVVLEANVTEDMKFSCPVLALSRVEF